MDVLVKRLEKKALSLEEFLREMSGLSPKTKALLAKLLQKILEEELRS